MSKLFRKFAVAVGLAALAGYVTGLLTAPKSGKEVRRDIKHAAEVGLTESEKQLKRLLSELTALSDEVKKRGAEFGGKANKELAGLMERAQAAREKARQVLSAIHEGDAEDKDLHAAVHDANMAIDHLKEYLKK